MQNKIDNNITWNKVLTRSTEIKNILTLQLRTKVINMIRDITVQDAPVITKIYNEYVQNSVISFETEPVSVPEMRRRIEEISARYPYLVYEEAGIIVGYCFAHGWKTRAAYSRTWETTVYVDATAQGKGIGSELMRHLIKKCRSAGAHTLVACITGSNEKSIMLHQRLGFQRVSNFRQVGMKFGLWLDVVDFQLLL